MITQHENGDVLEGDRVIASWVRFEDEASAPNILHIERADFARIVAMANRAEQLEAHLVVVCDAYERDANEYGDSGRDAEYIAARAFLKGESK
jgi:hypothetical protein